MNICQFDTWKLYKNVVDCDTLTKCTSLANSVMLINKDIMCSTRQYETILREEPRYWHAKNPVKLTIFINYRGIQNQCVNTNISDNQEPDKFKKKLIGVVKYGLLEKDASTFIGLKMPRNRFSSSLES